MTRARRRSWDFPYYGAVDTTPQWINLLGAYCPRQGTGILDERLTDRLWRSITVRDSLLAALAWIVGRMDDPIGGGYLWVRRAGPHGIQNQVWEDSFDSYYHADGSLFDGTRPYAPVAVQGYAYDALQVGADLLERSPGMLPFDAEWLRGRAWRLREQVLTQFWQADLGTFAQALTVESNGQLSARASRGVQRRASAGQHVARRPRRGPAPSRPDRASQPARTCWAAPAFGRSRPRRRAFAPARTTTGRSGRWTRG